MTRCPRCTGALQRLEQDGASLALCSACRGIACHADDLFRLVGRVVEGHLDLDGDPADEARCPACDTVMVRMRDGEAAFSSCPACAVHWLDAGVVAALRAAPRGGPAMAVAAAPAVATSTASSPAASTPSAPAPLIVTTAASGERVLDDRVAFGSPLVDLLAYPIVGVVACVVGVLGVGRTIAFLAQLWFHELGHAVVAWLSGRAALPLPVGFTFWREEPSWFTTVCVTFLIGVFAYASIREKRRAALALAVALFVAQLVCTLVVDDQAMIEWILIGGLAGELILSTVAILAFYYPAPDKLRWDFFRFVLLVPAATTFVSSLAMWIRIDRGEEGLPLGSILGAPGDGTGDVDRLMDVYGWSGRGLTDLYRVIGLVCLFVIAVQYGVFAWRAIRRRAAERATRSPHRLA